MWSECSVFNLVGEGNKAARPILVGIKAGLLSGVLLLRCSLGFAGYPLITDDAATQGMGNFQLELNGEYSRDREGGTKEDSTSIETVLTYGFADTLDLVLTLPFEHVRVRESGARSTHYGLSDISVELKWRFLEDSGWALAIKPGVSLPTGDHHEGLGAGRASPTFFFITSKELEPWAFHFNAGYIRNENRVDERTDLWHASLASELKVLEGLKLVGNVGAERSPDPGRGTPSVFILGGVIYSVLENLDLNIGVKGGLTRSEADLSIRWGMAWRF